jgi:hypothetical protein
MEWLECGDAEKMLVHLGSEASPRGDRDEFGLVTRRLLQYLTEEPKDRKLRLLACACCRGIWDLLQDERSRKAVETSERYADGLASKKDLATARVAARAVGPYAAERAVWYATTRPAWHGVTEVMHKARSAAAGRRAMPRGAAWDEETLSHSALIHDLFGNPFRPVTLDPSWPTSTVVLLARAAYDERQLPSGYLDLDQLAVLADALEEAGCSGHPVLEHLRGPGPHVRGCWAVDLILAKE